MKELTLIFFGIIFLAVGITTVLKKKFGPEEGMRGFTFHGKIAVFAGTILIILGVFSLVVVILT